ncbi:MAG: hypothetical protein DRG80_03390, partial [Deltaproteobacteria bacterium]
DSGEGLWGQSKKWSFCVMSAIKSFQAIGFPGCIQLSVLPILNATKRIRLDCVSAANHNLNRLLDKPGHHI